MYIRDVPNGAFDVYSWDVLLWYTVDSVRFEWALLCPKLSGCLLQRHGGDSGLNVTLH
jgi:hypothetical protein